MLKLSLLEFILRSIPEEFIFILAVHAFSKVAINKKKYILSGIIFSIAVYFIRLFPIEYGVHTLLSLIALIIIVNCINRINMVKVIRSSIIIFIIAFVFEGINVAFIQLVLKKDLNIIINNSVFRVLIGLPSVIILGVSIIVYYSQLSKRKELRYI